MASELERFRDHCRKMAESTPTTRIRAEWGSSSNPGGRDLTIPVGEMSDTDRLLWGRMAAEAAAYLVQDPDVVSEVAEPAPDDVPLF